MDPTDHLISVNPRSQLVNKLEDIGSRFGKDIDWRKNGKVSDTHRKQGNEIHGDSILRIKVNRLDGRSWGRMIKGRYDTHRERNITRQTQSCRKRKLFNIAVQNKIIVTLFTRLEINHGMLMDCVLRLLWLICDGENQIERRNRQTCSYKTECRCIFLYHKQFAFSATLLLISIFLGFRLVHEWFRVTLSEEQIS